MTNYNFLYNRESCGDIVGKNLFSEKKLRFQILENATVLPHKFLDVNGKWTWGVGGIVDENGNFVKNSFVHTGAGEAYTPSEEVEYSRETVIYLGLFYHVWGHAFTDNIRRLWFLSSDFYKIYFNNCKKIYIPWAGILPETATGTFGNFLRILEILNVDFENWQPITKPVKYARIILPDESFFIDETRNGDRCFTAEYVQEIDKIRDFGEKNYTPLDSKKIYFYYGDYAAYITGKSDMINVVGENLLADYFKSKGYAILSPEKFSSFDEELNVLLNAEKFASTVGSCSHNSVFLRDGTEVILIPRSAKRFSGYQISLDCLHDLNINYIDSSLSVCDTQNGPYFLYVSDPLKIYFGDEVKEKFSEDTLRAFLHYIRYCIGGNFKVNESQMQYYAPIYQKMMSEIQNRPDLSEEYKITFV